MLRTVHRQQLQGDSSQEKACQFITYYSARNERFPKQLDASTQSPLSIGFLGMLFLQTMYSIIMIQSYSPSSTFKCSLSILFTSQLQGMCHLQSCLRFGLQEATALPVN